MSTNEELIAAAKEAVKGHAPTEAEAFAYRLADALEKVTAERDADVVAMARESVHTASATGAALSYIAEAFTKLGFQGMRERAEKAEQERDALAAVVAEICKEAEGAYESIPAHNVDIVLDAAPSVALDRVKAEAWSEGFGEGRGADHNSMWWPKNPYRKGGSDE